MVRCDHESGTIGWHSEASSVSKSDTEAVIGAFVDLGRSWSFL